MTIYSTDAQITREKGAWIPEFIHRAGYEVSEDVIQGVADVVFSLLAVRANQTTYSPLKYYNTTYFSDTSNQIFSDLDLLEPRENGVSLGDQLFYYGLMQTIGKSMGLFLSVDTEVPLTLLSSPKCMEYLCKQEWFQELRANFATHVAQAGSRVFEKALYYLLEKKINELRANYLDPIEKFISGDREDLIRNVQESLIEQKDLQLENIRSLFANSVKLASYVRERVCERSLGNLDANEKAYWRFKEVERQCGKGVRLKQSIEQVYNLFSSGDSLSDFGKGGKALRHLTPRVRLKNRKEAPRTSLCSRLIAASSISHHAVTPLLLTSPSSTAPEIALRVVACLSSYSMGYGLPVLLGSEICIYKMPGRVKEHPFVQPATEIYQRGVEKVERYLSRKEEELESLLVDSGFSSEEATAFQFLGSQFGLGFLFSLTNHHSIYSTPLYGFTGNSFVEYSGILLDHFGVSDKRYFRKQSDWLQSIPFQLATGVAMTAIEQTALAQFRVFEPTTLMKAVFAMPFVTDQVVESDWYQEYVIRPIKEQMYNFRDYVLETDFYIEHFSEQVDKKCADYHKLRAGLLGYKMLETAVSFIPDSELVGPFRYIKHLPRALQVIGGGVALKKAYNLLHHPHTKKVGQVAAAGLNMYAMYNSNAIVSLYVGAEIGSLVNIVKMPKDHRLLPVILTSLSAAYCTQSPLLSTLVACTSQKIMEDERVQRVLDGPLQAISNGVTGVVKQTVKDITYLTSRPRDVITCVSEGVSLAVALTTNSVALTALAMKATDDVLRNRSVQSTAKKVSDFVVRIPCNLLHGCLDKTTKAWNGFFR